MGRDRVLLVAVVVTHERPEQLRRTLASLMAVSHQALAHVVVVDNCSQDSTAAVLEDLPSARVRVLRLPDNRGGAGGFEAGLRMAAEEFDPDWIVLMDDDARPLPGALEAFVGAQPATAAAAAAVFHPNGPICEMNRPGRNPFWHPGRLLRTLAFGSRRGFHLADVDYAAGAPIVEVDTASFVGFFLGRAARLRAGLPDGQLFIYGDDVLYSLRLRRAGLGIGFMPQIRFEHDCAAFGLGFSYRPLWKVYYHCRNGVAIARAAAGPLVFPAALAWYLLQWLGRSRHVPAAERGLYRQLIWWGIRDGLRRRGGRNDSVHRRAEGLVEGPGSPD